MPKPPPLTFERTRTGLTPADSYTAGKLDDFALGTQFRATTMTRRSHKQLGLYFSVLREVVDATGAWATPQHLHEALKLNLGFHTTIKTLKGKEYVVPDSAAFDAMDAEQFGEFFEAAMAKLSEFTGSDVLADYYALTGQNYESAA